MDGMQKILWVNICILGTFFLFSMPVLNTGDKIHVHILLKLMDFVLIHQSKWDSLRTWMRHLSHFYYFRLHFLGVSGNKKYNMFHVSVFFLKKVKFKNTYSTYYLSN